MHPRDAPYEALGSARFEWIGRCRLSSIVHGLVYNHGFAQIIYCHQYDVSCLKIVHFVRV
jgi:hypothetical protein